MAFVPVFCSNIEYLKQSGIIIFLDVPIHMLKEMNPRNRPLLKDINNLDILYNDRYHLYNKYADIIINKTTSDIEPRNKISFRTDLERSCLTSLPATRKSP